MPSEILGAAERVLHERERKRPWLTSAGIARRARLPAPVAELEQALLAHAASERRRIRYSYYPSKKTLQLLWGHVDLVGDPRRLPSPDREDVADPADEVGTGVDRWCFLSHNRRDSRFVFQLRNVLISAGVGAWLYESDIECGEGIAEGVRAGLSQCQAVLGYLSRHSLNSMWVRKELEAASFSGLPVLLVLDGRDHELQQLVREVVAESNWSSSFAGLSRAIPAIRREKWAFRAEQFIHSMGEYLRQDYPLMTFTSGVLGLFGETGDRVSAARLRQLVPST